MSDEDKTEISGEDFYNKYIKTGGFVLFPEVMRHSENFIQKSDGSFRNASLVSPILFLVLQAAGKEISTRYVSQRPADIDVYYAGNYELRRPRYKQDYDDFFKAINAGAEQYQYETAWNELERCEIEIEELEENFCIKGTDLQDYSIYTILQDIKRLQGLFPYRVFTSREMLIKSQECSICGKTISVRKPCGHVPGKIYMGKMCLRRITDAEFVNENIVTKPLDKYAILKLQGQKFDFTLLDYIIPRIAPYSHWEYSVEKRLKPEYMRIGRNMLCPCGSGKKYKYCIRNNPNDHYEEHYKFSVGR